jgi:hypothetical protein
VSLPGASELFRPTHDSEATAEPPGLAAVQDAPAGPVEKPTGGTGRVRHDEKITVYVSSDELLSLERARLELRARHGLAVDRGRIVREAIAATLADFEGAGEDSQLVRRLS